MRTSTKIGLIGISSTLIVQAIVGFVEVRDYRRGKRRINKKDIDLIAEGVVTKQEELKKAKKKTTKPVIKEEKAA
ncbi:MAG: hypothetical protein ACNA7U_03640 [Candidatus Izemoplasmataceae bacterium]